MKIRSKMNKVSLFVSGSVKREITYNAFEFGMKKSFSFDIEH